VRALVLMVAILASGPVGAGTLDLALTEITEWKAVYGVPPDKHRAYALQWFTLALVLMVIYIGVNTKRHGQNMTE